MDEDVFYQIEMILFGLKRKIYLAHTYLHATQIQLLLLPLF